MYEETTEKLLEFISKSPTAFQAAEETRRRFLEEGFTELKEEERWELEKGGKYFVMRNHSAIIGFSIPVNDCRRYHIIASHSDSPSFKIKENPEMSVNGAYVKLNVERYGGMILSTWFDRPLSVAGRMLVHKNGKILEKLVDIDRDLVMIPSLAIHMNRDINGGYHYNVQKDMLPLYSGSGEKGNFMRMLAEEAEVRPEDILGHDLFLYNRMPGTIWGSRNEFVSSPRLDDLQCAFASMEGFLQADRKKVIAVHCLLDNEEVGSTTKQGAASTFLKDVLFRINLALGGDQESYLMALAESFMISADNAHALHPNIAEQGLGVSSAPDDPLEQVAVTVHAVSIPVSFAKAWPTLKETIEATKPNIVIATGLKHAARGVMLERCATNLMDAIKPDADNVIPRREPIDPNGPAAYWTRLPLRSILNDFTDDSIPATLSSDAGTFVCNSLFYNLLNWTATQEQVLGGFVSFPPVVPAHSSQHGLPLDQQIAAGRDVVREAVRYYLKPSSSDILIA